MELTLPNVTLVLSGIILCAVVYWQARRNNFEKSLFAVILLGLILRLFCAADPYLHFWDERYHFLVAKNLMQHPFTPTLYPQALLEFNYKNWTQNHVWLHKPPMTLWLIASSFKIFGVSVFAGRLPSIILSTATIFFIYKIALMVLGEKWLALSTAFFQAVNGLIIELSAGRVPTDHVDTTFFFFMTAGLYCVLAFDKQKNKNLFLVLTGAVFGFALLIKWLIALCLLPAFLLLYVKKYGVFYSLRAILIISVIGFSMALPWHFYTFHNFPKEALWESKFNLMHFTHDIEEHAAPWWFFLDKARINWNELIYPAWIYFAYLVYKNPKNLAYQLIAVWIILPYLVFSVALSKMQGYVLFTAPAQFMILSLFLSFLYHHFKNKNAFVFKLAFYTVIGLSLRYCIERVKPFYPPNHKEFITEKILEFKTEADDKTALFNTPYFIEVMFFTDAIAYERIPSPEEIDKLKNAGFKILISEKNLPAEFTQNTDLQIIPAFD